MVRPGNARMRSYVTRLTYNDDWDSHPAYSPDGKKIVFASDRSGNDEIWIMNADGTGAV